MKTRAPGDIARARYGGVHGAALVHKSDLLLTLCIDTRWALSLCTTCEIATHHRDDLTVYTDVVMNGGTDAGTDDSQD